jgi:hypothetical protein
VLSLEVDGRCGDGTTEAWKAPDRYANPDEARTAARVNGVNEREDRSESRERSGRPRSESTRTNRVIGRTSPWGPRPASHPGPDADRGTPASTRRGSAGRGTSGPTHHPTTTPGVGRVHWADSASTSTAVGPTTTTRRSRHGVGLRKGPRSRRSRERPGGASVTSEVAARAGPQARAGPSSVDARRRKHRSRATEGSEARSAASHASRERGGFRESAVRSSVSHRQGGFRESAVRSKPLSGRRTVTERGDGRRRGVQTNPSSSHDRHTDEPTRPRTNRTTEPRRECP